MCERKRVDIREVKRGRYKGKWIAQIHGEKSFLTTLGQEVEQIKDAARYASQGGAIQLVQRFPGKYRLKGDKDIVKKMISEKRKGDNGRKDKDHEQPVEPDQEETDDKE